MCRHAKGIRMPYITQGARELGVKHQNAEHRRHLADEMDAAHDELKVV